MDSAIMRLNAEITVVCYILLACRNPLFSFIWTLTVPSGPFLLFDMSEADLVSVSITHTNARQN